MSDITLRQTIRGLQQEYANQHQQRGGFTPKRWRTLAANAASAVSAHLIPYYTDANELPGASAGAKIGRKLSMQGGIIVTDLIVAVAPAQWETTTKIQIFEDTYLDNFTSTLGAPTTRFDVGLAATAAGTGNEQVGTVWRDLNIYTDRYLKFTLTNGYATPPAWLIVSVGYVDEGVQLSATGGTSPGITNTWSS